MNQNFRKKIAKRCAWGGVFVLIVLCLFVSAQNTISPEDNFLKSYQATQQESQDNSANDNQVTPPTQSNNEVTTQASNTIVPADPLPVVEDEPWMVGDGEDDEANLCNSNDAFVPNEDDLKIWWQWATINGKTTITFDTNEDGSKQEGVDGWHQNVIDTSVDTEGVQRNTPGWFKYNYLAGQYIIKNSIADLDLSTTKSWFSTAYKTGKNPTQPRMTVIDGLKNIALGESLKDMSYMFAGAGIKGAVTITNGWESNGVVDLSHATDTSGMFCSSFVNFGVTTGSTALIKTDAVIDTKYMLQDLRGITSFDMDQMSLSNATNLTGLFYVNSNLSEINNIPQVDLSKGITAKSMFRKTGVTTLDLMKFSTSAAGANLTTMFEGCTSLEKILVAKTTDWSDCKEDSLNMFANCTNKLKGGVNTTWDATVTSYAYARVDKGHDLQSTPNPGYFTTRVTITHADPDSTKHAHINHVPQYGKEITVEQGTYVVYNETKEETGAPTLVISKCPENFYCVEKHTGYSLTNTVWALNNVNVPNGTYAITENMEFNITDNAATANKHELTFNQQGGMINEPSGEKTWDEPAGRGGYHDMGCAKLDYHPISSSNGASYYDLYHKQTQGIAGYCAYLPDLNFYMETGGSYNISVDYELDGSEPAGTDAEDFRLYWARTDAIQNGRSTELEHQTQVVFWSNGQSGVNRHFSYDITREGSIIELPSGKKETIGKTFQYYDAEKVAHDYSGFMGFRIDPKNLKHHIKIYNFTITDNNNPQNKKIATFDGALPEISKRVPMSYKRGFLGWYDQPGIGNGTQYYRANGMPNKIAFQVDADVPLYAHWIDDLRNYPDNEIPVSHEVEGKETEDIGYPYYAESTGYVPNKDSEHYHMDKPEYASQAYNTSWLKCSTLTPNTQYYYHASFYTDANLKNLITESSSVPIKIFFKPKRTGTPQSDTWYWWGQANHSFIYDGNQSSYQDAQGHIPIVTADRADMIFRYNGETYINGSLITDFYTGNVFVCLKETLKTEDGYGVKKS